jgi:N-acetylglutamate synthase-like GNAT family acetyltransferase
MLATPKKIRRQRPHGQASVEQTHDPAVIAVMLDRAGVPVSVDFTGSAGCFLIAYLGDDPVGIAGLQTEVDAAIICPLFVLETMRRRGVGASLMRAVREAAHARGARTLYAAAPSMFVGYFTRFGFVETGLSELIKTFGQVSTRRRTRSDDVSDCHAVRLDISRDGLIER